MAHVNVGGSAKMDEAVYFEISFIRVCETYLRKNSIKLIRSVTNIGDCVPTGPLHQS